jgi:hypothetical protein
MVFQMSVVTGGQIKFGIIPKIVNAAPIVMDALADNIFVGASQLNDEGLLGLQLFFGKQPFVGCAAGPN